MCLGRGRATPAPAPLPPAPLPPPPPPAPLPVPEEKKTTAINAQVKRAQSKKDKNPFSKGTKSLKIPLGNTGLNTPTDQGSGGMNV
jgi:hypothetical protein